ncbi:hypothetical protein JYU34_011433 [Plutella xylostella]|uniref:Uncharacterized protein n=1 Tax=Plutella xylostella TaxID=51655 RepID=A0ABQ7QHT3_PLUXY|nr:hypothetical protein JYU34_011433 [Plutella xylostella]
MFGKVSTILVVLFLSSVFSRSVPIPVADIDGLEIVMVEDTAPLVRNAWMEDSAVFHETHCPEGLQMDALGICREVWGDEDYVYMERNF